MAWKTETNKVVKKSEKSAGQLEADKRLLKTGKGCVGFFIVLFILFKACSGGGNPDPCDCLPILKQKNNIKIEGFNRYYSTVDKDLKKKYQKCERAYRNQYNCEIECGKKNGRW